MSSLQTNGSLRQFLSVGILCIEFYCLSTLCFVSIKCTVLSFILIPHYNILLQHRVMVEQRKLLGLFYITLARELKGMFSSLLCLDNFHKSSTTSLYLKTNTNPSIDLKTSCDLGFTKFK